MKRSGAAHYSPCATKNVQVQGTEMTIKASRTKKNDSEVEVGDQQDLGKLHSVLITMKLQHDLNGFNCVS